MNWDSFLDDLAKWLDQRELLNPRASWVIGASGGLDSTLLLHAMKALSEQRELGLKLHAAHLNHGLRGAEAEDDQQFVSELAEQLGIVFHVERADIQNHLKKHGGSIEEVARRHRYEFLERVALTAGSDYVAVGHHADDDAETILHRICRGTGLRGLAGISDLRPIHNGSRVRLIRPFLHHCRAVLKAICIARGFETRTDSTNTSTVFTRNRIRQDILPLLRESLNPNVTDALLRLAEQARWVGSYLEQAAARTFEALLISESAHQIVLNIPALLNKHRAIQSAVVRRAFILIAGGEQDLFFSHSEAVLRLAHDPASGKELHLPGRIIVTKRYDRLEIHPATPEESPPEFAPMLINCPGRTPLPLLKSELVAKLRTVNASKIEELRRSPQPNEEWLDYDQLRLPLLVRGRQVGDRFHPLGAPGAKSVSDFLSDEKIDPQTRARTGILCDQQGLIWIMPFRIDERVKLSTATRRALHLILRPPGSQTVD